MGLSVEIMNKQKKETGIKCTVESTGVVYITLAQSKLENLTSVLLRVMWSIKRVKVRGNLKENLIKI